MVLVGRRPEPLELVVKDVVAAGGRATAVSADVTRYEQVDAAAGAAVAEYGHVDIVVSNAGGPNEFGGTLDMAPETWAATIDVNLNGHWNTAKATVPHLRANGGGHFIFMGSSTSYQAESGSRRTAWRKPGSPCSARSSRPSSGPTTSR